MITFKQKEYGRNDKNDFHNTSESVIRDLIKLLVMGYNPRNANYHWTERASTFILDAGKGNLKNIPRANIFLGVTFKEERNKENGIVVGLFNETPENYIRRLWIEVASEKDENKNLKYSGMIKLSPTDQEILEVLEKIRYIVLCLTSQCIPENFRWDNESMRIKINFETSELDKIKNTPDMIRKIISIITGMGLGITYKGL